MATKYRKNERPDLQGGVVIIYNGEVTDWTRSLSEPHRFRPGCIAVDATGGRYEFTKAQDRGIAIDMQEIIWKMAKGAISEKFDA